MNFLTKALCLFALTLSGAALSQNEFSTKIAKICKTDECVQKWQKQWNGCDNAFCLFSVMAAAEINERNSAIKKSSNNKVNKKVVKQFEVLATRSCKSADCLDSKKNKFNECQTNNCRNTLVKIEMKILNYCDDQENRKDCLSKTYQGIYKGCFDNKCEQKKTVENIGTAPVDSITPVVTTPAVETMDAVVKNETAPVDSITPVVTTPAVETTNSTVRTPVSSNSSSAVSSQDDEVSSVLVADKESVVTTPKTFAYISDKATIETVLRKPRYKSKNGPRYLGEDGQLSADIKARLSDEQSRDYFKWQARVAYPGMCDSVECIQALEEGIRPYFPDVPAKSNTELILQLLRDVDSRNQKHKRGEIISVQEFGRALAHPLKDDFEFTPPEKDIEKIFLEHGMFSEQMVKYFKSGAVKIPQNIKDSYKGYYEGRVCFKDELKADCEKSKELELYYEAIAQYFNFTTTYVEGKKILYLDQAPGYFLAIGNLGSLPSRVTCRFTAEMIPSDLIPYQETIEPKGFLGVTRVGKSLSDCYKQLEPMVSAYREDLKNAGNYPRKLDVTFTFPGLPQWSFSIGDSVKGECHGFIFVPREEKSLAYPNWDWVYLDTPLMKDHFHAGNFYFKGSERIWRQNTDFHWLNLESNSWVVKKRSFKNVTKERCLYEAEKLRNQMDPTNFEEFLFAIGDKTDHRISSKHMAQDWLTHNKYTSFSAHTNSPARSQPYCETKYTSTGHDASGAIIEKNTIGKASLRGTSEKPIGGCEETCTGSYKFLMDANEKFNKRKWPDGTVKPDHRNFSCHYVSGSAAKNNPYLPYRVDYFKAPNEADKKLCEHFSYTLSDKPITRYYAKTEKECLDQSNSPYSQLQSGKYAVDLEVKFDGKSIYRHQSGSTCHMSFVDKFTKGAPEVRDSKAVKTKKECHTACVSFKKSHEGTIKKSGNVVLCEVEVGGERRKINDMFAKDSDPLIMINSELDPKTEEQVLQEMFPL